MSRVSDEDVAEIIKMEEPHGDSQKPEAPQAPTAACGNEEPPRQATPRSAGGAHGQRSQQEVVVTAEGAREIGGLDLKRALECTMGRDERGSRGPDAGPAANEAMVPKEESDA